MAKPDDRSDNVEKLQNMIGNTMENIREARDYLKANTGEIDEKERENIKEKNQRREDSIDSYRAEIKDETNDT